MTHPLRVSEQWFSVGQQMVADSHRLRALEVRIAGHHPSRVRSSLAGQGVDRLGDRRDQHRRGGTAVESKVKRDLVVARTAGVQGGAGRRELGQPALDRRVDVLVGLLEIELTGVELPFDPPETALDRGQPGLRQKARRREPARVGDAPRDIERIELEIDLQG